MNYDYIHQGDCLVLMNELPNASSMNNTIYKLEATTDRLVRCRELKWGDTFVVTADSQLAQIFDGNPYSDYRIVKIHYKPKKWWQFWKKKIPLFYVIAYVGKNK